MYKKIDDAIENANTFQEIATEIATLIRTYDDDKEAIHEGADLIERALARVQYKVATMRK